MGYNSWVAYKGLHIVVGVYKGHVSLCNMVGLVASLVYRSNRHMEDLEDILDNKVVEGKEVDKVYNFVLGRLVLEGKVGDRVGDKVVGNVEGKVVDMVLGKELDIRF